MVMCIFLWSYLYPLIDYLYHTLDFLYPLQGYLYLLIDKVYPPLETILSYFNISVYPRMGLTRKE